MAVKAQEKPKKKGIELKALPDNFLMCRNALHAWDEVAAAEMPKPATKGDWWEVFECMRCKSTRTRLISLKVSIVRGARYVYSENYRLAEKFSRSEFRVEYAKRHNINKPSQATRRK